MSARKIIHLDMDCFYAAIEMHENPGLVGQPIAVGGSRSGERRGVLTTCNYEARKYGVRSAMPTFQALQRCPHLVVLPVRFDLYRAVSKKVGSIFQLWTDCIEPLSLDEAYLDVSHREESGAAIAAAIRRMIFAETGLTASAGIAANKLLAKVASDWRKPNGQFEVEEAGVLAFMQALSVRKLHGIGSVTAQKLENQGILTCGDLQGFSRLELNQRFGRLGLELYDLCRGVDERPVESDRVRKSLSTERTFDRNLTGIESCEAALEELHADFLVDLSKSVPTSEKTRDGAGQKTGRCIQKLFVKVKFADFTRTTAECLGSKPDLLKYRQLLVEAQQRRVQPVRLLGLGVRFAEEREESQILLAF
jgi:DNA polymerase-4